VFWFSLQLLSEKFLILRRLERDVITNVHLSSCQLPVFSWQIFTWIFSTYFRETLKYEISRTSVHCVPICYMSDRQADMTKLRVAFHNFASAPKYNGVSLMAIQYTMTDYSFFCGCLGVRHAASQGRPKFFSFQLKATRSNIRIVGAPLYRVIEKDGRDLKPL